MTRKIGLVLVLLFCTSLSFLSARPRDIEVIHGDMKLVVNQKTGAYFVYYVKDLQLGKYEPLFADRKFGTSFLKIRADGEECTPSRDRRFSVSCALLPDEEDTVVVSYTSDIVDVTQRLSFLYDTKLDEAYGIKIDWKITSKLEVTKNFATKYVLDTSVGEGGIPFFTDQTSSIKKEEQLVWPYNDAFVVSPGHKYALMLMLRGQNVTTPSKVVFANWQRLFDSGWSFEFVSGRNFSLLPYSVDDSAVCLYWPAEYIDPGESLMISLVLGRYKEGGLVPLQGQEENGPQPVQPIMPAQVEQQKVELIPESPQILEEPEPVVKESPFQAEILAIIDRIDYLMLHPEEAVENEVSDLERQLLELQDKVNGQE